MQIHFHLGVHFTESAILLQALERSSTAPSAQSVICVPPERTNRVLEAVLSTRGARPDAGALIAELAATPELPRRLVLFSDDLLGQPLHVVRDAALYDGADRRLRRLFGLFEDAPLSLSLALLEPASYLERLASRYGTEQAQRLSDALDPQQLSWTDLFKDLRSAAPDSPITIWRHEDLPMIWEDAIAVVAGLSAGDAIPGRFDLMAKLLPPEAMRRLADYMSTHPVRSRAQYRQILRSFLTLYEVPGYDTGPGGRLRARAAERKAGHGAYAKDLAALPRLPLFQLLRV